MHLNKVRIHQSDQKLLGTQAGGNDETDAPGLMKLRRPEWKWKDCVFTPTHTEIVFTLKPLRHSFSAHNQSYCTFS